MGNRTLLLHVFHGPGISTALGKVPTGGLFRKHCSHGITSSCSGGGTDRYHFTDETWTYRLAPDKWVQVPKP